MSVEGNLPLTDEGIQILKRSCAAFSDAAKGKFGCTAVVPHMDLPTASVSGRNKGPEIRYTKQLSGGVKISVWKDDLTAHKVDAVVNAANEHLNHGGGLALALRKAGGEEIQYESDLFVKRYGKVSPGNVAVTAAGKLPCKMIIHAVGPCVPPNPSQQDVNNAAPYLQNAIRNIFAFAEHNNLQSVAIPAISSGLFNFPRDICADIIVDSVLSFSHQRQPPARSLEVHLVNNDDPTVQAMQRACQQFLGHSDMQSRAMQSQSTSSTKSAYPSLELGNVTLFLKKGEIQDEMTDVIVNPIGDDLILSKGLVSLAILQKAGHGIQDEVKKKRPRYLDNGDVIETKGYNLKSQAVFHAVCTVGQSNPQILDKVIARCLKMAEGHGFSSISFPAIGTGHLGFTKEQVSQKMIRAVAEFAEKHKGKKKNVFLVIYPKDTDNFKAFEIEMNRIMNKSPKIVSNSDKGSAMHSRGMGAETPSCIEFFAESSEALRETKAWAVRMLQKRSSTITIQNNHVIHFGQKDHEYLMSLQTVFEVSITEFIRDGKCGIIINGDPTGVSCAALEVEVMLCKAQEEFAQAEENDLLHSVVCWKGFGGSDEPEINAALEKEYLAEKKAMDLTVSGQKIKIDFRQMQVDSQSGRGPIQRISLFSLYEELSSLESKSYYETSTIDEKSNDSRDFFSKNGLDIVKVEKIKNNALKQVFELNKKRVSPYPKRLYQCVKAQFCELISRVGFQRDYAPPEEQKCGAGIYFTTEPRKALELWQDREEEHIYIIEAHVLTGNSTSSKSSRGLPQLIVPPSTSDPQVNYDSVCNDQRDTYVIFSGQQALPECIYTCTKKHADMSSGSYTPRVTRDNQRY